MKIKHVPRWCCLLCTWQTFYAAVVASRSQYIEIIFVTLGTVIYFRKYRALYGDRNRGKLLLFLIIRVRAKCKWERDRWVCPPSNSLKTVLKFKYLVSNQNSFPQKLTGDWIRGILVALQLKTYLPVSYVRKEQLKCMALSPSSDANICSLTPEFINTLCRSEVHYFFPQEPPSVHILSQMNPIYIHLTCFSKIPFQFILRSTFIYSCCSLYFGFSYQNPDCLRVCYMPCPSNPRWKDRYNYTWRGVQIFKLSWQFFHGSFYFVPPRSKYCP